MLKRICALCILLCMAVVSAQADKVSVYTYQVDYLYYTAVNGVMNPEPDYRESTVQITIKNTITIDPPASAYEGYLFDAANSANILSRTLEDTQTIYPFCVVYVKNEQVVVETPPPPVTVEVNIAGGNISAVAGDMIFLDGYAQAQNGTVDHVAVYCGDILLWEETPVSDYFDFSMHGIDTNIAPLNVPGTYAVTVRITDSDGVSASYAGGEITIAPVQVEAKVSEFDPVQIAAGHAHTAVLRPDGTVISFGSNKDDRNPKRVVDVYQTSVSDWTGITAIDCGEYHTVGLKADGTVVTAGLNKEGQRDVSGWNNIIAIAAGEFHTVGVQKGGMALFATGWNKNGACNVSGLVYPGASPIVAVAAGYEHTVVLREDGTAAAVGNNKAGSGQCNLHSWTDIVQIDAGTYHTVGLRADGTVVAAGDNTYGQCNVASWQDITAIAAGDYFTIGLRADGTVVSTGQNDDGQCNVYGWTDIVKIGAGHSHTVGLQADGTSIAIGGNSYGQCAGFSIPRSAAP